MIEILISSSVLIVAVCLMRTLLRNRISPRILYGLWGLVALRLLAPWFYPLRSLLEAWKSRVSVMNAVSQVHTQVIAGTTLEPLADNVMHGRLYHWDAGDGAVTLAQQAAGIDWQLWIMVIWIAGSLILLGWMAAVNLRFERWLRLNGSRYQGQLPEFVTRPVYVVEGLESPCYVGTGRREAIYLPKAIAGQEEMVRHALAHEMCHAMQHDRIWGVLRCGLLCYYWVNPLVWLAAFLSRQDCEMACDELAVKLLGEDERFAYGRTLIRLASGHGRAYSLLSAATTMAAGKGTIRNRIRLLARHPRTTAVMVAQVTAAAAGLVACTFSGGVEAEHAATESGAAAEGENGAGTDENGEPEEPGTAGGESLTEKDGSRKSGESHREPAEPVGQMTDSESWDGEVLSADTERPVGVGDELVLVKEEQWGIYYRLTFRRRDQETGELLPVCRSSRAESGPYVEVQRENSLSGPDFGYGSSFGGAEGRYEFQVDFANQERAEAMRITLYGDGADGDAEQSLSYRYETDNPPEVLSCSTHELVQGVDDTAAVLTDLVLYSNAAWLRFQAIETEEGTNEFAPKNLLALQVEQEGSEPVLCYPTVAGHGDGKMEYLFRFDGDRFPGSRLKALVVSESNGENPKNQELLSMQIYEAALGFAEAYMAEDYRLAGTYCTFPKQLDEPIGRNPDHPVSMRLAGINSEGEQTEQVYASYCFVAEGETDSYTYLSMTLEQVDEAWKVVFAGFEK